MYYVPLIFYVCSNPVCDTVVSYIVTLYGITMVSYIVTLCVTQWSVHCLQEGGVSGFLHAFIAEVFAMVRAHVAALGGNAVVSYIMKQCVFMENPSKNQVR